MEEMKNIPTDFLECKPVRSEDIIGSADKYDDVHHTSPHKIAFPFTHRAKERKSDFIWRA
jgi:hypothetical protein